MCSQWRSALLVLAFVGCGAAVDPRAPATLRMVRRLEELAASVDLETTPAANAARVRVLKAAPVPSDTAGRVRFESKLGQELLYAGRTGEATAIFQRLFREVQGYGSDVPAEVGRVLLDWLALTHVTEAVSDWCRASASSGQPCAIPPMETGTPDARRRATVAARGYQWLVQSDPSNLAARWLLNVAYMTWGGYPAEVPAQWLIPPEAFASEYQLPRFREIAGPLGLDVRGHAGGSVMDDLDGDGDLDIMASSEDLRDQLRLFLNNGDGTFSERTSEAGLLGLVGGLNLVPADYDNDGGLDVLVLRGGWDRGGQPSSLLRNRGDGRFEDVTEAAGLLLPYRSTQTASWGDYDNDGWIDLYMGSESADRASPNQLFRNNGDGTFTDVAAETGTAVVGFNKAVAWGDIDNDGRLDLYISRLDGRNVLLHNQGPHRLGRWRFRDITERAGVALPIESFPTWFWDYDNDGWLDIFVSGFRFVNPRDCASDVAAEYLGLAHRAELPRLYRNRGDGRFTDVTREVGLDRVLYAMGANYGDLDNDGFLDFYVGTGDPDFRSLIPNRMFRNDGGKRFQEVTTAGGFGLIAKGHAVSFGDLDNDGDQDLYAVMGGHYEADVASNVLFENPGMGNHWLTLKLEGVKSNRAAIGARIEVIVETDSGLRAIHAMVSSGGSFGASSLQQEIGLGKARAVREVRITWPGRRDADNYPGLPFNRAYRIREGDLLAHPITAPTVTLTGNVERPRGAGRTSPTGSLASSFRKWRGPTGSTSSTAGRRHLP